MNSKDNKFHKIYESEIKGPLKVAISIIIGFALEFLFLVCSAIINIITNKYFPSKVPMSFTVLHIITTVSSIGTAIFFLLIRPFMIIFDEYFKKRKGDRQ